jgi:hypothetical protein
MADPIDAGDSPATDDELRAELFSLQPPLGIFFEVLGEPTMFAFIAMALVSLALRRLRTILLCIPSTGWDIA